jgi:hypothetical protein
MRAFTFCVHTVRLAIYQRDVRLYLSGPACSSGKAVTRNQKTGMAKRSKPPTVDTSLQKERLRIAERIVQALREAGYSCGLADKAYSLNGVDLRTRH